MKIAILNAGGNLDYLSGLVSGLARQGGLQIEVLDSDQSLGRFDHLPNVRVISLLGQPGRDVPMRYKIWRHIRYYIRLFRYAVRTKATIFHIQWLTRFAFFEQVLVLPWFRLLGKRLVLTAHNVDTEARNTGRSSFRNRMALSFMYRGMDRIIAHTESIRSELVSRFGLRRDRIEVIPSGLLWTGKPSGVCQSAAREQLSIPVDAHVVLFFGNWEPYKGLDLLVRAVAAAISADPALHLLIAGAAERPSYRAEIQALVRQLGIERSVTMRARHVSEGDLELYFLAADCAVLPYRRISQSGVPFMAYSFGLPVIASKVGGLVETIFEGRTGFLFEPGDVTAIRGAMARYFLSDLYKDLDRNRQRIAEMAARMFSWETIALRTAMTYSSLTEASVRPASCADSLSK
jgi:glycosyltransferase involved in cell wall biosynthesis